MSGTSCPHVPRSDIAGRGVSRSRDIDQRDAPWSALQRVPVLRHGVQVAGPRTVVRRQDRRAAGRIALATSRLAGGRVPAALWWSELHTGTQSVHVLPPPPRSPWRVRTVTRADSVPEGFNFPDSGPAPPVACALPYRKELDAVLAPVLPRPPSPRSRKSPTGREGHRATGAPAPGEGAAAAGDAPSTPPSRPGPVGGREQGDDKEHLVLVRGEAADPAPLASGTRQEEVDI